MNVARNNTFEFQISGYKTISLTCQEVPVSGITNGQALIESSPFDLYVPDNRLDFDPLTINLLVDDKMTSWFEAADWLYKVQQTDDAHLSLSTVAILVIQDNNFQPIMTVEYNGVVPVGLGQIQYLTNDGNVTEITAAFSFRYDGMNVYHHASGRQLLYRQ